MAIERQDYVGAAASLPVVGAAAVAGYAYFDTLQVAKTAVRMLQEIGLEVRADL